MKPSNCDRCRQLPAFLITIILSGLLFFAVAGCGSSGGDGGGGNDGSNNSTVTMSSDVTVVDSANVAAQIAEVSVNDDDEVNLTTISGSDFGKNLHVDSVITVIPDLDKRFPFGLSGKIARIATNSDGSATFTLKAAQLNEVVDSTKQKANVALNADNFIGVVSPSATQEAAATYDSIAATGLNKSSSDASDSSTKYAINGGIVVRNSMNSMVLSKNSALSDVIDPGDVELNLRVPLADMGIDTSEMIQDAAFVITGSLKNLMLNHAVDFGLESGLKEMKMIASGDINLDVNLSAGGSTAFGYYDDAWDEVEDVLASYCGVSGKLTGLDSKDKFGKFPLVGLAWSIPSSTLLTTTSGNTQTAIDMASIGGIIIWLYLDAEGTITLDGEFGSRVNSAQFSVGVEKPENENLDIVYSLTNSGEERLLELPYINGSAGFAGRTGVTIDVDAFVFGLRLANASAGFAADFNTDIEGYLVSHGIDKLGEDWRWEGSLCLDTNYGAGLILSAMVNLGVEIDVGGWRFDLGNNFSYFGQWPSEVEIETPGWHGIGDLTWYTADGSHNCWGEPDGGEDADGDSYSESEGDCNDYNPNIHPGANETCNDDIDNDCDDQVDCQDRDDCNGDEACRICTDSDSDNYFAGSGCATALDCNDSDPGIHPGASEICDNENDDDCDGDIDSSDSDCSTCKDSSVNLTTSTPVEDNMFFSYGGAAYDSYYLNHWKIKAMDGYMEFSFDGMKDFFLHGLGSTSSGVSHCYVDIYVNGSLYESDNFINKNWTWYEVPSSQFSAGNNTVRLVLTGNTHLWVDEAAAACD